MKKWICFSCVLLPLLGLLNISLQAQILGDSIPRSASTATNKATDAIAMYEAGKFEQAKALLAAIPKDDPEYPVAQRYRTLCLHGLKDYHGFMKAIESIDVRATGIVSPQIAERLAYNHIDGLFYFRRFEDIFPVIRTFQTDHPTSDRSGAVVEYRLAALFERGLKKTLEACQLKDENKFNRRWTEGRTNLQEFLSSAHLSSLNQYAVLTNRSLTDDVWAARFILGDGSAVMAEIPAQDAANREKFSLLRVLLYPKLQPDRIDENLQRLSEFLKEFPDSRNRPRVEFEMADVALKKGEQFVTEARLASNARVAAENRASAAPYLNLARANFSNVREDKEAVVGAGEVRDAKEGLLRVCFAQEDWPHLSALTAQMMAESQFGGKEWRAAKMYAGAGLVLQEKLDDAATVLDELLASGFQSNPSYDGPVVAAARWRIRVARRMGDEASAQRVIQQVQNSECEDSIKRTFLKTFQTPMAPEAVSK